MLSLYVLSTLLAATVLGLTIVLLRASAAVARAERRAARAERDAYGARVDRAATVQRARRARPWLDYRTVVGGLTVDIPSSPPARPMLGDAIRPSVAELRRRMQEGGR